MVWDEWSGIGGRSVLCTVWWYGYGPVGNRYLESRAAIRGAEGGRVSEGVTKRVTSFIRQTDRQTDMGRTDRQTDRQTVNQCKCGWVLGVRARAVKLKRLGSPGLCGRRDMGR